MGPEPSTLGDTFLYRTRQRLSDHSTASDSPLPRANGTPHGLEPRRHLADRRPAAGPGRAHHRRPGAAGARHRRRPDLGPGRPRPVPALAAAGHGPLLRRPGAAGDLGHPAPLLAPRRGLRHHRHRGGKGRTYTTLKRDFDGASGIKINGDFYRLRVAADAGESSGETDLPPGTRVIFQTFDGTTAIVHLAHSAPDSGARQHTE